MDSLLDLQPFAEEKGGERGERLRTSAVRLINTRLEKKGGGGKGKKKGGKIRSPE